MLPKHTTAHKHTQAHTTLTEEIQLFTYRELGLTASSAPLNPKCLRHGSYPEASATGQTESDVMLTFRHFSFIYLIHNKIGSPI